VFALQLGTAISSPIPDASHAITFQQMLQSSGADYETRRGYQLISRKGGPSLQQLIDEGTVQSGSKTARIIETNQKWRGHVVPKFPNTEEGKAESVVVSFSP